MVLVSILGDFHSSIIPISYEFRDKITHHIIVYDDAKSDIKEASRIIQGQENLKQLDPNVKFEIKPIIIDEDDYYSILGCIQKIKNIASSYDDIYINTTDGLSSIAIVLSNHFLDIGSKVIAYDRYDNTYNLHTSNGMQKHTVQNNLDIKAHLLMKGYKIKELISKDTLEFNKPHIYKLMSDTTRYKEFSDLLNKQRFDEIAGYNDIKSTLNEIGYTKQHKIQGAIFEEYIYHIIKDNFEFDDIQTGIKVEFDDDVENEFDILMIKNNHLHTIECKFVNKLNGEHYVYKTYAIKDYLDDDGRAMILSIGADNQTISKSGRKSVQFNRGDKARAKYTQIKLHQSKEFNKEKFLQEIKEWFCI